MTAPLPDLPARADTPDPVVGPADLSAWPAGTLDRFVTAGLVVEIGPAAAVACPGCDRDHVELIRWADGAGRGRRAFVTCPEAGLIPVAPAAPRRWVVRAGELARAVAGAAGAAGDPAEVVPGRVWRLGPVRAAGRTGRRSWRGRPNWRAARRWCSSPG